MYKRIGIIIVTTLAIGGCGGGGHFANRPSPPSPINLTVYINDQRVSISPAAIGAGPVNFIVTNQASTAQSLAVLPAGNAAGQALADTGPINPQATTQVTVNLATPGQYTIGITPNASTEAAAAVPTGVRPAVLTVGQPRPSASNQLLQP